MRGNFVNYNIGPGRCFCGIKKLKKKIFGEKLGVLGALEKLPVGEFSYAKLRGRFLGTKIKKTNIFWILGNVGWVRKKSPCSGNFVNLPILGPGSMFFSNQKIKKAKFLENWVYWVRLEKPRDLGNFFN